MRSNFLAVALLSLGLLAGKALALPVIYTVQVDASGSISVEDFRKACRAVASFADLLFERSQKRPGQPADWLAINFFGGPTDYEGTVYINCSDQYSLQLMKDWMLSHAHPQHGSTAIYDAIANGLVETMAHDNQLPYLYIKNIIVITDGENTAQSSEELVAEVREYFPDQHHNLFLVSVGSAKLADFEGIADDILHVEGFGELGEALVDISDLFD